MYEYSEEITKYLFNQMNLIQRLIFEVKLDKDEELAAEVARQQDMLDTIQACLVAKEAEEDPHYEEAEQLAVEAIAARKGKVRMKPEPGRAILPKFLFRGIILMPLVVLDNLSLQFTELHPIRMKLQHETWALFLKLWVRLWARDF